MNALMPAAAGLLLAPGIVAQDVNLYTIPNQSAHFVRMPSREASTEIDAVFSNPAGLVGLEDGFHLSINNQFLRQASRVVSDYELLNEVPTAYEGVAGSFVFPSVYGAWRKGDWAASFGVLMVGGAGGAQYTNLPTPDAGIADVIPLMKTTLDPMDRFIANTTGENPGYARLQAYRFDFVSEGLAFSPGLQAGGTYRITPYLSVAAGLRFVQQFFHATSTLSGVEVHHPDYGGWSSPSDYMAMVAEDDRLGGFEDIARALSNKLAEDLADVHADARRYGWGLTPILGAHVRFSDDVHLGMRYEHNTAMTLKTSVADGKDGAGTFVDGERFRSDLPGYVATGLRVSVTPRLDAHVGGRVLFDRATDWNGRDSLVENNYYEVAAAAQYTLTDRLLLSCGYTYNKPRVAPDYQNEGDYRLPGHTGAVGGAWDIHGNLRLNLGVMYTFFVSETNTYVHAVGGSEQNPRSFDLTFGKSALVGAVGVDIHFRKEE